MCKSTKHKVKFTNLILILIFCKISIAKLLWALNHCKKLYNRQKCYYARHFEVSMLFEQGIRKWKNKQMWRYPEVLLTMHNYTLNIKIIIFFVGILCQIGQ